MKMTLEQFIVNLSLLLEQDNNLEKVQEIINLFNTEIYPNLDKTMPLHFDSIFNIFDLNKNYLNNQGFDYMLNNMRGFQKANLALFQRAKAKLLDIKDEEQKRDQIINFLNEELKNNNYNIDKNILVQNLVQLIAHLKDRKEKISFLQKVKALIEEDPEDV